MSIVKRAIRKTLSTLGYEIHRLSGPQVRFDNFTNLAQAYEQRINESSPLIPQNEVRHKLLARLLGTPPSEAYFIVQALAQCQTVAGSVCEFGVAQGETSTLIANEIAQSGTKVLHLFDSFAGLPMPSEKDKLMNDIFSLGSMEAYAGTMSSPDDMVRARLKAISFPPERYVIHKGFIERIIPEASNLPTAVCFAYVDFDFYEPIKIALKFLDKVTSVGGVIIVDDYNFFSTGSKSAVDEFVQEKNSGEILYDCFVPDTCYGHFAVLTKRAIQAVS